MRGAIERKKITPKKIETAKRGISLNLIFKLAEVLNVKEEEFFKF